MRTIIVTAMLMLGLVAPLPAMEMSQEEIVCSLDPKCAKPPLTRSLRRGVTVSGGATDQPLSVNIYVNFDYNSADLTSDSRITLDRLGAALGDKRLESFSFLIAGHTDARGGVEYNQRLSERRSEAVRRYLIERFKIASQRLTAVGYGKSQLLDPSRPEDGVNRRVQVVNITATEKRR